MFDERWIAKCIQKFGYCAIIAHVAPDGDTLGSTIALSLALDGIGLHSDVFCENAVPHTYAFLPGIDKVKKPTKSSSAYPLAISVDVSDYQRLGICAKLFDQANERIVLDHHITNSGFGDHNLIEECAASAQIVLRVIDALGTRVTPDIALCLYVALATDTGNFTYSNTTDSALRAAARLVEIGVDVPDVIKRVYRTRTPSKTRLLGRAIASLRLEMGGQVALMRLMKEDYLQCGSDDSETEGLINYGIECEGVKVAVMARETPEGVKFSLRSSGDVDVGTLACKLGGGGHIAASGVTILDSVNVAEARVFAAICAALDT